MESEQIRASKPEPVSAPYVLANERMSGMPPLLRVSQVDRDLPADSPLAVVVKWIREYLAKPHPDLGRRGPVCPFVPTSLDLDTIWMCEVSVTEPTAEGIANVIIAYRDLFLRTEPARLPEALQKSVLVVFSTLQSRGTEGEALVDQVQYRLKRYFVELGLMIGEFHANNASPGLRNPNFRPLRCPVPMLAIRHMVESDFPFLARKSYPPQERSSFLRGYLSALGSTLIPSRFDQALEALIGAEAELWIAGIRAGTRAPVTQSFVLDTALDSILAGVVP
jgi:hypothetical protein